MPTTKSSLRRPLTGRERESQKQKNVEIVKTADSQRPFTKMNFIMMGACVALIIAGFILMAGGGSSIEGGFNPDIFSTRRIVVGPCIAFIGFIAMGAAIIIDPKRLSIKKK